MELEQQLAEANARSSEFQAQLARATTAPTSAAEQAKAAFEVPEGEQHLVHAYVTKKNGVAVASPQVEPFHPNVYRTLTQPGTGFQAEVFHQPTPTK